MRRTIRERVEIVSDFVVWGAATAAGLWAAANGEQPLGVLTLAVGYLVIRPRPKMKESEERRHG